MIKYSTIQGETNVRRDYLLIHNKPKVMQTTIVHSLIKTTRVIRLHESIPAI